MKTVAIIGAGPSGLVTAKTLLRSSTCQYKVTIFEKSSEVGGLWAVHRDRPYDGMLNPEMPTNLSRFNIGFSDLAWSSAGLASHVPYWPKAWQVGQYLRKYTDRYIPQDTFLFNTKVTNAAAAAASHSGPTSSWNLEWETQSPTGSKTKSQGIFDYLVVATGFFGTSSIPNFVTTEKSHVPIVHSTKLRKLTDVLPNDTKIEGTLLVVGGGMSGADVATVIATQLSDAKCSPTNDEDNYSKLKFVQLCPERAYALPLAAACDTDEPQAPHFMPLDLAMYKLDKRPPGPIEMQVGQVPAEVVKMVHDAFQGLVGDQSDLGVPDFTYKDASRTAYVTLTERYAGFIRAGDIQIATGRLKELRPRMDNNNKNQDVPRVDALYVDGQEIKTMEKVVGIVYATGFTPQPSLSFLSPEIRKILEHDDQHNRLPVLLEEHATLHSQAPGLAIIGFHEGAFWGSMEMEARLVERRWSGQKNSEEEQPSTANGFHYHPPKSNGVNHPSDNPSKSTSTTTSHLKALRQAMTAKEGNVPQYWMGDYVGMMEQIARETNTTRHDLDFPEPRWGPISHARYTDPTCDQTETDITLGEFKQVLTDCSTKSLFVGRATFLGLHGTWRIERNIVSRLSTMPSGTLRGTAKFHPRTPTDSEFDFEYLYIEQGDFIMDNNPGMTMTATRRYVYRYQESSDKITVWFVKDDGKTVDYLYHGLTFDVGSSRLQVVDSANGEDGAAGETGEEEKGRSEGWLAHADHLCIKDMYQSDYTFAFKGSNLKKVKVVHEVKGPKKDYVSETWFER